jgi:hypothetical protein
MHAIAEPGEVQAHRLDDRVGVSGADEPPNLPVGVDDPMHERRQEGVLAALHRNHRVRQPVEHIIALDHQEVEIVDESLIPARLHDRVVKLPVELEPARRRRVGRLLLHFIADEIQLHEPRRRAVVTRRARRRQFDGFTVFMQVLHFGRRVVSQPQAAVHFVLQENPLGNQLLQPFAHGNAAQLQLRGDFALHQPIARKIRLGKNQPDKSLKIWRGAIDSRLKHAAAFRHSRMQADRISGEKP